MQHGKHIAISFGALFCAALLTLTPAIGQTQARYENAVSWKGIIAPEEKPVFQSNYLAEGGRTVLLNKWLISGSSYRTLGIQLAADNGSMTGTLQCEVNSNLLTAKLDQSAFTLDRSGNHATLTLTTTSEAEMLTAPTEVTVRVTWISGEMSAWADLKVLLYASGMTVPTQKVQGVAVAESGSAAMAAPDRYAPEEGLHLKLTLPQGTDRVVLNYEGDKFPENTVYVINGESAVALAYENHIEIPTDGRAQLELELDLSWTTAWQNRFMLSVAAYAGNDELWAVNKTISPTRQALEIRQDAAASILGADGQVKLPVRGDLEGLEWKLERLTQSGYTPSDALHIHTENTANAEESVLVITNEHTRAQAGTYRLTVERVYEDKVLCSIELVIFVCY